MNDVDRPVSLACISVCRLAYCTSKTQEMKSEREMDKEEWRGKEREMGRKKKRKEGERRKGGKEGSIDVGEKKEKKRRGGMVGLLGRGAHLASWVPIMGVLFIRERGSKGYL